MSESKKGTILLVHPRIKLSNKVRRQLDAEGYIVLRALPGEVSFRGETGEDLVTRVAIECLLDGTWSSDHQKKLGKLFARQVLNLLPPLPEAAKEPPKK